MAAAGLASQAQDELAATIRRLTGKWLGFGAESEINDGPWTLTRVTRDTRKASLQSYNRPAADKTPDGDDAE